MKRMLAGLALVLGTAALSGCYYDPDYSYVRGNGYQGDAYYGQGPAVIYQPDYYGYYGSGYYGPGYGPGYYGYGSGVNIGISGTWYDRSHHYRGRDYRYDRPRARNDRARQWRGDRDDHSRGDRRDHGDRYDNRRRNGH
jgi:hypothetical protein